MFYVLTERVTSKTADEFLAILWFNKVFKRQTFNNSVHPHSLSYTSCITAFIILLLVDTKHLILEKTFLKVSLEQDTASFIYHLQQAT